MKKKVFLSLLLITAMLFCTVLPAAAEEKVYPDSYTSYAFGVFITASDGDEPYMLIPDFSVNMVFEGEDENLKTDISLYRRQGWYIEDSEIKDITLASKTAHETIVNNLPLYSTGDDVLYLNSARLRSDKLTAVSFKITDDDPGVKHSVFVAVAATDRVGKFAYIKTESIYVPMVDDTVTLPADVIARFSEKREGISDLTTAVTITADITKALDVLDDWNEESQTPVIAITDKSGNTTNIKAQQISGGENYFAYSPTHDFFYRTGNNSITVETADVAFDDIDKIGVLHNGELWEAENIKVTVSEICHGTEVASGTYTAKPASVKGGELFNFDMTPGGAEPPDTSSVFNKTSSTGTFVAVAAVSFVIGALVMFFISKGRREGEKAMHN